MCENQSRGLSWVLKTTAPVAMGYIPLGLAFGAFTVSLGFPFYIAPLTAFIVFAGSMEFLLLGMIATGTGLFHIALATLLVNSRHIFYGISYPWQLLKTPLARGYGAFSLTDEAYGLISSGIRPVNQRELLLIQAAGHVYCIGLLVLWSALLPEFLSHRRLMGLILP